MSIKVINLLYKNFPADGEAMEVYLLVTLAKFGDEQGGSIFPSTDLLGRTMRTSESATHRWLAKAIAHDYLIVVDNKAGGRGKSCVYRINPSLLRITQSEKVLTNDTLSNTQKGATGDTKGCHWEPERVPPVKLKGAMDGTQVVRDPLVDQLETHTAAPPDGGAVGVDGALEQQTPKPKINGDAPPELRLFLEIMPARQDEGDEKASAISFPP